MDFVVLIKEVLCSSFVKRFLRCLSVSFLLPDGAWTLMMLMLSSDDVVGFNKKCCAVRSDPPASYKFDSME